MNEVKFSLLSNYHTYGIELRERNYPTFKYSGNVYHGTQYGDNTQICHIKRVKAWKEKQLTE